MDYETFRYNRKELYKQVWSRPVTTVAKEYGISDVGLRKICKKLKVPLPGVGYWQKRLHGKRIKHPPLPPFSGSDELIVQRCVRRGLPIDEMQNKEALSKIAYERQSQNRILISSGLDHPHQLVAQAERSLRNARLDERGILRPRARKCLDIRVSPATVERTLRIMDALIKALEGRGFEVSIKIGDEVSTSVSLLGESLRFGLRESMKRSRRELTPAQKKRREEYPLSYISPEYDYTPTGRLALVIKDFHGCGLRKKWSDGKKQRAEDCLNSFIIGLIKAAVEKRSLRLDRERQHREWEDRERKRAEKLRLLREEEARLREMEREVAAWRKSQEIRAYVTAMKKAAIQKHGRLDPDSELGRRLTWASRANRQIASIR